MQIDHLIYAVPDLDAGVEDVERRLGTQRPRGCGECRRERGGKDLRLHGPAS